MNDLESLKRIFDLAGFLYTTAKVKYSKKTIFAPTVTTLTVSPKNEEKMVEKRHSIDFLFDRNGILIGQHIRRVIGAKA